MHARVLGTTLVIFFVFFTPYACFFLGTVTGPTGILVILLYGTLIIFLMLERTRELSLLVVEYHGNLHIITCLCLRVRFAVCMF